MKPQEEMARKTLEEFIDEVLGENITLGDLVFFLFGFLRSAEQTLKKRGENDEMEKENNRLKPQNNYWKNVLEQQTYDVDEYKLFEKDVKSVIKKITAKYCEHKKELQLRANPRGA